MTATLAPVFVGVPGGMEMIVILLIAVLLFGADRIPRLARSTGEALGEFRRGRMELEEEFEKAQNESPTTSTITTDADESTENSVEKETEENA